MPTVHRLTAAVVSALVISIECANALPRFVSRVPNAQAIFGVNALGHRNSAGGGALNAFGEAFRAQGTQWTTALCHEDSDRDGATNGEELGDPCCKWTEASSGQLGSQVSHPGVANTWTPQQLQVMKCKEDSSPETTTAGATSAAAATSAPPVAATATESPLRERPRAAVVGVDGSASTDDGSGDDDELPSTVDPNGLRETPPSLMPLAPAPTSKPKAKTPPSPTPTPAKSGSGSSAGQQVTLGIAVVTVAALLAL